MIVGLKIGNVFNEIGTGDFLHSFFSTISFHLEPNGWGTRFPELLQELYQGKLEPAHAKAALADAQTIKSKLAELAPAKVIWDIADLKKKAPWGKRIDKSVTSLANFHITTTGRVLMDLLVDCLEYQVESGKVLTIGKL
jgi:2,3-bisphosphoglycerate-dependent phosphoglycerate mutase